MTDWLPLFAWSGVVAAPVLLAWLRDRRFKALARAATAFSEEAFLYVRVKADGTISIEDEREMGRAAIRFFAELERLGIARDG